MSGIVKLKNLYPLESWFFSDIAQHPEALKKQWFNIFSGNKPLSIPNLNEIMVETIFIKKYKWLEVKEIIDFVTRTGPHLVMFQEKGKHKELIGILRLKKLSKLYDGSKEEYRLYMQRRFIQEFFEKGEVFVFDKQGLSSDFINFLKNQISTEAIEKIILTVQGKSSAKTFDLIMRLTKSASLMQFLTVKPEYIFPLINQVTYMIHYKMRLNFICAIIEQNVLSEAIFSLDSIHRKLFKNEKKVFIVAKNYNFKNYQTNKKNKTWLLLIDCESGAKTSSLVLQKNIERKKGCES